MRQNDEKGPGILYGRKRGVKMEEGGREDGRYGGGRMRRGREEDLGKGGGRGI